MTLAVVSGGKAALSSPAFLRELERQVAAHPAVSHPFLSRFAAASLSREQVLAFGLQHYQLVRVFTTYMTNLVAREPSWAVPLEGVFRDEYGQHTIFRSHAHLYRDFLRSAGAADADWGRVEWAPETRAFIDAHLALTREGDPLEALGAIGPGHEFSIPLMFTPIVEGLERSGLLAEKDLEYFTAHIVEDEGHALAFNGLIEAGARSAGDLERVRRGTLRSLELRDRLWDGCERLVFGARREKP